MIKKFLFPILTGLLLYAAWPTSPFTFLIFFAWVPLFWLEKNIANDSRFFLLLYLNLFIWNIGTTWWIWNASPGGAAGAIVANSALMCFPWMLYRYSRKKMGETAGLFGLVVFWLSFEYIHQNWELSWPWLTLGNIFSTSTGWIQWYEYTGTPGGSLWILLVNILVFKSIKNNPAHDPKTGKGFNAGRLHIKTFSLALAVVLLPLLISFYLSLDLNTIVPSTRNNVVVVQPNVEAYTEKFNTDPNILIDRMIAQSETVIDSNTRLLVWPETAIPTPVWEHEIRTNHYYEKVFALTHRHPKILLVSGIDSYKNWGDKDPGGFSIRTMKNGTHYEAFNTAFATDSSAAFELYHKSKLVPGVETLPSWLGFMSSIFDDLGGTTGTLGHSDSVTVFSFEGNPYAPAPIICYESIYGDYVADYCRKGANILTVITNDGWWGNTQGYKQHMNMSRLRAIENRKWVARSANTGISCFINPKGVVMDPQPWDTAAAIKMNVLPETAATFYTMHGDWISRLAWPLALAVLLWSLFLGVRIKWLKNKR